MRWERRGMSLEASGRQGSEEDDLQGTLAMESHGTEDIEMTDNQRIPSADKLSFVDELKENQLKNNQLRKASYENAGFDKGSKDDLESNFPQANGKTSSDTDFYNRDSPENDESYNFKIFSSIKRTFDFYYSKFQQYIKFLVIVLLTVVFFVYLGFAVHISWDASASWCDGSRFLVILTIITAIILFYFYIIKKYFGRALTKCCSPMVSPLRKVTGYRWFSVISFLVVMGVFLLFVIFDSNSRQERLISYSGIWVLLTLGFIFSKHPGKVIIRHVAWGIGMQFVFALLILRWKVGKEIFQCIGNKVAAFLSYTDKGSEFMFGYLASGKLNPGEATITAVGNETMSAFNMTAVNIVLPDQMTIFAFKVLPVVLFFSLCVSILYYYGIMQWIVLKVGWLLRVTVGTTAAESMNAAGNIFMGMTEAPLLVKPYLPLMTKSELHAIMTGGFATIAGSVLAAYIKFGISASHLLSASVMSAPAALAFAKLFYPETEASQTTISEIKINKGKERNALEAATAGVTQAVGLVANIAANLIAFIAFIYFIDELIMWFGSLVGWSFLSLTYIMSYVFMPLSFVMGVDWEECNQVGKLIGYKTIVNEFVAYSELGKMKADLSCRSQIIATYALCGFSNLSSIGIQLAGLGAMAPNKMSDLSQVAFRAMIAGSCACFMTACVAGALIDTAESETC